MGRFVFDQKAEIRDAQRKAMPIQVHELQFLSDTTWDHVLEVWRAREEEAWRTHYEERGFASWMDWRMAYNAKFVPGSRIWKLYKVKKPEETIPQCLVGAYHGWKKYYPAGADVATFGDLAKEEKIRENLTVQNVVRHFPEHRQLVAFRCGEDMVIRDGTHHCAATALAVHEGLPVSGEVTIAIAQFGENEKELFIQSYDQRFAPTAQK